MVRTPAPQAENGSSILLRATKFVDVKISDLILVYLTNLVEDLGSEFSCPAK